MVLVVQKCGGSSIVDAEAIKRVVERIVEVKRYGHSVVVMVSAAGDITGDLLNLVAQVTTHASEHKMDMLLSAGERISMSLLATAVSELREAALSFTGRQAGVYTGDHLGKAAIAPMIPERIARSINEGNVVIAADSQGVSRRNDITTFGRGGLDITAVTLVASL